MTILWQAWWTSLCQRLRAKTDGGRAREKVALIKTYRKCLVTLRIVTAVCAFSPLLCVVVNHYQLNAKVINREQDATNSDLIIHYEDASRCLDD